MVGGPPAHVIALMDKADDLSISIFSIFYVDIYLSSTLSLSLYTILSYCCAVDRQKEQKGRERDITQTNSGRADSCSFYPCWTVQLVL